MLSVKEASQGFSAVGSESRLSVLMILVRAGDDGLTVGEIQTKLSIPASTLAHHLRVLSGAGLIMQNKLGREVINQANYDKINMLGEYILSECCLDMPKK